ncbi:TniQ family protein [Lysinibacillus sp. FSL P2-0066]|uniref:TniQ family protein n=1 Tax=Lysinibacillus sp. FSL P2-0066 TaxID=2921720 RepID=UPI0030D9AC8F
MKVRRTFTIRPKLIEGESLSSYIVRTANLNGVTNISEIWQLVKKQGPYKVDRNFIYKFDLFPTDIVHLNDLAILLNIKANELVLHSFEPIVSFFYPGAAGKMVFGKEIELKHRRFCRSCLKENGAFQFLWQVKEIHICNKHLTKIESKCYRCGCEQSYVKKALLEHLNCSACGELLYKTIDKPSQNYNLIDKQLRIYRDWHSISTFVNYINSNNQKMPQSIHRKIAILLLYLTTPNTGSINYKKHPFFAPSQAKRLLELVRNKSNDTLRLGFILNTLRELDIEMGNFLCLEVPISFMRRLISKAKDKKIQVVDCKSEWCKSYNTPYKMIDMKFSKDKYVPKAHFYHQICVCTDCWIRVGFSKELSKWEDANISKGLLREINNSIVLGFSEKEIIHRLKINSDILYFYMGYIYRFNPFHNNNLNPEDRVKEVSGSNLIDKFSLLKSFWKRNEQLTLQATKLFGWDVLSTYYYYWHHKVQQYIYLEENLRTTNIQKRIQLKNEVNRVIMHLVENNMEISVKEVAASLDITENTLRYHKLRKNINEEKLKNKLKKENEEKAIIFQKINEYIINKKANEEPILVHEVYKNIGVTEKVIKKYPVIARFISNSVKESKTEQKLIKKRNLEKTIIQIYKQYGRVDYFLLSEFLGVAKKTLTSSSGVYKGISSLIKNILADLENDKSCNTNNKK